MTDQEFKEFYDNACVSAGRITAPETRVTANLILSMLYHLYAHMQPKKEA